MRKLYPFLILLITFLSGCTERFHMEKKEGFILIKNEGGATLGYAASSGIKTIVSDRYSFKDLNRNGILDPYEDWRLSVSERALDLAEKMSVEDIAGLMLYSSHQSIPGSGRGYFAATYNGKSIEESEALSSDLSDQQKKFLKEDHLRHVLITSVESPAVAAQWNNNIQAYAEGLDLGIPVNTSSDPRHGSDSYAEYNAGAGGTISMWPSSLGIAATFDPSLMKQFGDVASREYRALGITTALSPQIDLATEPRWSRFDGTMGEDPDLATSMARSYVDGFQSTKGGDWGMESVNAMVKHWPGGGPEEGGRDGHFGYGAYAVYPGNNIEDHLKPFTEGAFKLDGPTKKTAAVMPYYTISSGQGEKVANGYNKYLITDLLRKTYGYDGVLCTDWGITRDITSVYKFEGKPYGVENLTEGERHFKAIQAGMDQFGGNNNIRPVLEAYHLGVNDMGEAKTRARFEESAVRLLTNIFRTGLFENPYLDVAETTKIVGKSEFMDAGFQAQLRSIVMLKNTNQSLPIKTKQKVYIPKRYIAKSTNWWGMSIKEKTVDPFNKAIVEKYFEVVDQPKEADFAIVGIESPNGGVGYDALDLEKGGNGYLPINLQYSPYTAKTARKVSLAGGSPLENFTNRSYRGKKVTTANVSDMKLVNETKNKMRAKPVIVCVKVSKPMVFSEIEKSSSAILMHTGVQDQALMEIISGGFEPSALLPFQMPSNMMTVEAQFEDVPRDMKPYTDAVGNSYDFAFGLDWSGVINDARVMEYK